MCEETILFKIYISMQKKNFRKYTNFHVSKTRSHLVLTSAFAIFENNRSNGKKMQMRRMGSVPILCVNVSVTRDTVLKFDANADADAKCDWT